MNFSNKPPVKVGTLQKHSLGAFFQSWKFRCFKLFAEDLYMTYDTPEGERKGKIKLMGKASGFLLPVSEKKPFVFKVSVKKFAPDGLKLIDKVKE